MFKPLYRCPRTVARHENGPLHESRLRYLEHLAAQGAALHTITAAAGMHGAIKWLIAASVALGYEPIFPL
jgi:hypothetical protein